LIEAKIKELLRDSIESLGLTFEGDILVERPRESSHGDLASPVALILASQAKSNPRNLAQEIVDRMNVCDDAIREVRVEGPGFINFSISDSYYHSVLREIIEEGERFGKGAGAGEDKRKVVVEFVSSNPTGPLTVGHGRQAVLGDIISNLLEWAGHEVVREYYFNDAGRQMNLLGQSVFARYAQSFDPHYPFPDDGYKGKYIIEIAESIREEKGDIYIGEEGEPLEGALDYMRLEAARRIVQVTETDLKDFRITFDRWYNESTLLENGKTAETIDRLKEVGAVYEKDNAVWFRATRYGDGEDRVLIKSGGEHTYFLTDIAYHVTKHERGFDLAINLHGADHHGYVPRMMAAMKALGYPETFLKYLIHQMVTFVEGGEQLRMSTRAGTFITLRELMEKVGVDVARYFFVMIKPDSHLVFDLDLARSHSLNNPVYYLQYAYARISSIFKYAEKEKFPVDIESYQADIDLELLGDEEMELMKQLSYYPEVLKGACEDLEPHRLTTYLGDLASAFHHWYERQRVVVKDRQLTRSRLFLCHCVRVILGSVLKTLGVTIPERM
jgi:arginyl-tRNA synthetase